MVSGSYSRLFDPDLVSVLGEASCTQRGDGQLFDPVSDEVIENPENVRLADTGE